MPRSHSRSANLLRFILGFFLLPPSLAGILVLASHLNRWQLDNLIQLTFLTGAGVYLVIHLLLWKPIFMHVMGHELTHAFWAVLLGGKIKSLQVSQAGGQVTLSKSNFLVALAPYFFPFYTFLLLPIYLICQPTFRPVLAFLLGFTLAFHYALTLHSLREHQSDLHELGVFFSLVFVVLMNVVVVMLIEYSLAPALISPPEFFRETWRDLVQWAAWAMEWVKPIPPAAGSAGPG